MAKKGVPWSPARREAFVRGVGNTVERFWSKVDKTGDCWLWQAGLASTGYGQFNSGSAHRFAYELVKGPIPEGLQIDHLCRNRKCVRPEHLEAVSCRENLLRGETLAALNVAKTRCPQGHGYTPENTYVVRRRNGRVFRVCKVCNREKCLKYQRRKRYESALAAN